MIRQLTRLAYSLSGVLLAGSALAAEQPEKAFAAPHAAERISAAPTAGSLVQVGNKQLLLGVAPGRVSTLHVLDEPVTTQTTNNAVTPAADGSTPPPADFKSILKRSLGL